MDAARMSEILAYCRIDEADVSPADKVLLTSMHRSAKAQLLKAGVAEPEAGTDDRAQYDMLVNRLVLDEWEHRGSQSAAGSLIENPAFRRELNQMKLDSLVPAVPDSGTAGL